MGKPAIPNRQKEKVASEVSDELQEAFDLLDEKLWIDSDYVQAVKRAFLAANRQEKTDAP